LPDLTGIRATPARAGRFGGETLGTGDFAEQLRRCQGPASRLGEELLCGLDDELGDLGFELGGRAR
jgi:hypothetical protein